MQIENSNKVEQEELENKIDLINFFKILLKRKKIISIFSFFGIFLSSIHIYSQGRIYSGNFSFIYEKGSKGSMLGNLGSWAVEQGFSTVGSLSNEMRNEIEILTSPYMLDSIYKDVLNLKNKSDNKSKNFEYEDFASKITIKIKTGTDVLKVSYKDKKRDDILPVLNMILDRYKQYSIQEEVDFLKNTTKYLAEQVDLLRVKARESTLRTERFGCRL